jgi:hypothetical protein
VTNVERKMSETRGDTPARRSWEAMSLTRIGTFGDILRGGSGKGIDALGKKA